MKDLNKGTGSTDIFAPAFPGEVAWVPATPDVDDDNEMNWDDEREEFIQIDEKFRLELAGVNSGKRLVNKTDLNNSYVDAIELTIVDNNSSK